MVPSESLRDDNTAFTFTAVRHRKCEVSVYTRLELPEIVLSCADRKGATDGQASLLSLWLLREQVFACSPPGGANTSHSVLTPGSVPGGALVLQHRFVFPVS